MSDELKKATERIKQLEDSFRHQKMFMPPEPDPTLAEDEWWAVFSDYRNTTTGTISKIPWKGGSNMTAVYKVKRVG